MIAIKLKDMTKFSSLIEQQRLSAGEARTLLKDLATGQFNEAQMAAILTVFLMRGIGIEELKGFREAMLDLCRPVHFERDTIDVCGTGGDAKNTFNISTLSAFVVAGAGQAVAKHGNYGVSSVCGSSNVIQHLGIEFQSEPEHLKDDLEKSNLCFLHAPLFHPAMKNVAPVRRALEVKTFFNMLGPMVNPSRPTYQMMGVFNLELARKIAYLYQEEERKFAIIHSLDGYDEISLTGAFKMYTHRGEYLLEPDDMGLPTLQPEEIFGGETVGDSANIFMKVLEGKGTSAQRAVVIANAGMALYCSDHVTQIKDGIQMAAESLDSGAAFQKFITLSPLRRPVSS